MDLREKVAEALYEAPDQLVAESAFGGLVRGEQRRQANERADKVMPVVSAHVDTMAAVIEQQRQEIEKLRDTAAVARYVAEHWRDVSVSTGWAIASHPLGLVLAAIDGETDVEALGLHEEDRAALERARENGDGK